jgi:hypothetical protein
VQSRLMAMLKGRGARHAPLPDSTKAKWRKHSSSREYIPRCGV